MQPKIDETICPLCWRGNGCMAHSDSRCWCVDLTVPHALIDLVPEAQQGHACICRACIEEFNNNQAEFIAKLRKITLLQDQL
ncbi:MAG: cysteine-rich CWC family protein [Desulfuromusa sp.]|nr:cysteine-rich CWC family protein [Desulfuromusa sp.]